MFEPRALNELFPDWKDRGAPVHTEAKEDKFLLLSEKGSLPVPQALLPPALVRCAMRRRAGALRPVDAR